MSQAQLSTAAPRMPSLLTCSPWSPQILSEVWGDPPYIYAGDSLWNQDGCASPQRMHAFLRPMMFVPVRAETLTLNRAAQ